jgi:hypothetical protein
VDEHGAELFTRGVQSNAGLGFGVLIFGVAMGALFAVPSALCMGESETLNRRYFRCCSRRVLSLWAAWWGS